MMWRLSAARATARSKSGGGCVAIPVLGRHTLQHISLGGSPSTEVDGSYPGGQNGGGQNGGGGPSVKLGARKDEDNRRRTPETEPMKL